MLQTILNTIRQTGIFILCAQAILQFKPGEQYEKYMKLFISIIVLLQLMSPIAQLILGIGESELEIRNENIVSRIVAQYDNNITDDMIYDTTIELANMAQEAEMSNQVDEGEEVKTKLNKIVDEKDIIIDEIRIQ